MKPVVRSWAALASVGLAVSAATVATGGPVSASGTSGRAALSGSLTSGVERSKPEGRVAAGSTVAFDLNLSLRNAAAAQALVKAVSTPGSAQYRHFLSQAQWIARFAPTQAAVASAETWLRQQGFTVGAVPADRLFVPASGSAAQVERAFDTTLGTYKVNGRDLRLASRTMSVPASIAGVVAGVVGINQSVATNDLSAGASQTSAAPAVTPSQEPPPPAAFKNPQPCSGVLRSEARHDGQRLAVRAIHGPAAIRHLRLQAGTAPGCVRSDQQHQHGHQRQRRHRSRSSTRTTRPTLLADAQQYFSLNDPSIPLRKSQFTNIKPASVGNEALTVRRAGGTPSRRSTSRPRTAWLRARTSSLWAPWTASTAACWPR